MPTKERVEQFIQAVMHEDHPSVIANHYHQDAFMQENLNPPRLGLEALVEFEKNAMANLQAMDAEPVETLLVDGDNVAIHWNFVATFPDGSKRRLVEVALQKWRGDKIAEERFFYDSASAWQSTPRLG